MALSRCPDCGRYFSTKAAGCPYCEKSAGDSAAKETQRTRARRRARILQDLGFILLVGGFLALFFSLAGGVVLFIIGFAVFIVGRVM